MKKHNQFNAQKYFGLKNGPKVKTAEAIGVDPILIWKGFGKTQSSIIFNLFEKCEHIVFASCNTTKIKKILIYAFICTCNKSTSQPRKLQKKTTHAPHHKHILYKL